MKNSKWLLVLVVFFSFLTCQKEKEVDLAEGIYASIITNKGKILINLTYKETPITVANFISLVEGTNSYLSDTIRHGKPYYNGLKFRDLTDSLTIQNYKSIAVGEYSSGYKFQDEFPKNSLGNLLRTFNRKGMLAMANTGKDTNGSQFFITKEPASQLNGKHTLFGFVMSGQEIIDALAPNDSIVKIDILRIGIEGKSFDATTIFSNSIDNFIKAKKAEELKIKLAKDLKDKKDKALRDKKAKALRAKKAKALRDKKNSLAKGIYARITTNKGEILINLTYKETPITVANFISLVEGSNPYVTSSNLKGKPFYNGIKFHRVIDKFIIQGGDPTETGRGGPGYSFKDEFPKNSSGKLLRTFNKKGMLAMANSGPNTNGSQFFITRVPTPSLNGTSTIYGYVLSGQKIVDAIVKNDFIIKIAIIRVGTKAKAFNAKAVFSNSLEGDIQEGQSTTEDKKKFDRIISKEEEDFLADMLRKGYRTQVFFSGLIIATIREGKGKKPKSGDKVSVHYIGKFVSGVEFDSSYKRNVPFKFKLGAGQVIKGWDFGIAMLKVGEKVILFIPSPMAYGSKGTGSIIPPNTNLIFEVELLDIED